MQVSWIESKADDLWLEVSHSQRSYTGNFLSGISPKRSGELHAPLLGRHQPLGQRMHTSSETLFLSCSKNMNVSEVV